MLLDDPASLRGRILGCGSHEYVQNESQSTMGIMLTPLKIEVEQLLGEGLGKRPLPQRFVA